MTLTVESAFQWSPTQIESSGTGREVSGSPSSKSTNTKHVRQMFNASSCEILLEEPAIGLWAMEAAETYGVKAIDALELLAYALSLDGEM